jgi:hypothetical protein
MYWGSFGEGYTTWRWLAGWLAFHLLAFFSSLLGLANPKVHMVRVYAPYPNERMFIQRFGHAAGLGR